MSQKQDAVKETETGPAVGGSSPALRIACPVCKAAAGSYCTKPDGSRQVIAHKRRREAAEHQRASFVMTTRLSEAARRLLTGQLGEIYGGAQHALRERLRAAGFVRYDGRIGAYVVTDAGRAAALEPAKKVHRRYFDDESRPDLRALAKCCNINGPMPDAQLTSVDAEVTCRRCRRIMAS